MKPVIFSYFKNGKVVLVTRTKKSDKPTIDNILRNNTVGQLPKTNGYTDFFIDKSKILQLKEALDIQEVVYEIIDDPVYPANFSRLRFPSEEY